MKKVKMSFQRLVYIEWWDPFDIKTGIDAREKFEASLPKTIVQSPPKIAPIHTLFYYLKRIMKHNFLKGITIHQNNLVKKS